MNLQRRDYETAQKIQKELLKKCPSDSTIQGFSQYLPEFIKDYQYNEDEDADEYYDDEEESEEEAEEEQEEEEEKIDEEELKK